MKKIVRVKATRRKGKFVKAHTRTIEGGKLKSGAGSELQKRKSAELDEIPRKDFDVWFSANENSTPEQREITKKVENKLLDRFGELGYENIYDKAVEHKGNKSAFYDKHVLHAQTLVEKKQVYHENLKIPHVIEKEKNKNLRARKVNFANTWDKTKRGMTAPEFTRTEPKKVAPSFTYKNGKLVKNK